MSGRAVWPTHWGSRSSSEGSGLSGDHRRGLPVGAQPSEQLWAVEEPRGAWGLVGRGAGKQSRHRALGTEAPDSVFSNLSIRGPTMAAC